MPQVRLSRFGGDPPGAPFVSTVPTSTARRNWRSRSPRWNSPNNVSQAIISIAPDLAASTSNDGEPSGRPTGAASSTLASRTSRLTPRRDATRERRGPRDQPLRPQRGRCAAAQRVVAQIHSCEILDQRTIILPRMPRLQPLEQLAFDLHTGRCRHTTSLSTTDPPATLRAGHPHSRTAAPRWPFDPGVCPNGRAYPFAP